MMSGELLGRTFFRRTSSQFLLIPDVMADRVNTAPWVCAQVKRKRGQAGSYKSAFEKH